MVLKTLISTLLIVFCCALTNAQIPSSFYEEEFEVVIGPNPFNHALTIDLSDSFKGVGTEIVISNVIGKKVKQINFIAKEENQIALPELAAGPYILSVYQNGKHMISKRIYKE